MKWGPNNHKCSTSVSLQVEELWQPVCGDVEDQPVCTNDQHSDSGDDLMAISTQAM